MRNYFIPVAIVSLLLFSCGPQKSGLVADDDPIPSWNMTPNKDAIVDFVAHATTPGDKGFIPEADRIAVFDNDGTLWCEQPMYVEADLSTAIIKKIAPGRSDLMKVPGIAAIANNDTAAIRRSSVEGLGQTFILSHTAINHMLFDTMTRQWLDSARNEKFGRKFTDLTYKPMVELIKYLQNHSFKTYIVTGGSTVFVRTFSQQLYNIPPEQVIGTMFKAEYDGVGVVLKPELWHNNNGSGKPEAIFQIIGRKPVMAFGNSDGDLQMLQWTSTNTLPNLEVLIHHTDSEREVAYDSLSKIGNLREALRVAQAKGWVVVDMQKDFYKMFSYE